MAVSVILTGVEAVGLPWGETPVLAASVTSTTNVALVVSLTFRLEVLPAIVELAGKFAGAKTDSELDSVKLRCKSLTSSR
jgi:TctA family transporter